MLRHFPRAAALAFAWLMAASLRAAEPAQTNALWFPVGEETFYDLRWGFIPVGQTHVTTGWTNDAGRDVIFIRYDTHSYKVIETLYPVEIFMESLIDPATFLPIRFTKRSREGTRRSQEVTEFDHAGRVAHWKSLLRNKQKDVPIEADTRDMISLMYYLRREPFRAGQVIRQRVMSDDKVYDLTIRGTAVEDVALDRYGKVRSVRLDPEAAFDGLFIHKGKISIWVSDDARRVCTRIVGEVPVASVRVQLAEVRGPGKDAWVARPAQ